MYTPQYYDQILNMAVALVDFRIEMMGNFVYVRGGTSPLAYIDVKLNSPANAPIRLFRHTGIVCKFDSLYISHPGGGDFLQLFISENINLLRYIETRTDVTIIDEDDTQFLVNNGVCVLAATEYTYTMGTNVNKGFLLKARGGDIQFSFNAGTSGTAYILLEDGHSFEIDDLSWPIGRVYYQSPTAGTVLEVLEKQ